MRYVINFGAGLEQSIIITEKFNDHYQVVIQLIDAVIVWFDAELNSSGHLTGDYVDAESNETRGMDVIDFMLNLGYSTAVCQLRDWEEFQVEKREMKCKGV